MKTVTISFLKDPLIRDREIRILAARFKNEGMKAREARGRAAREVSSVQNTQVMHLLNYNVDTEPINDIVFDVAKGRDYKFIVDTK